MDTKRLVMALCMGASACAMAGCAAPPHKVVLSTEDRNRHRRGTPLGCSHGHASSPIDELREQLLADEAFWASVRDMFVLNPGQALPERRHGRLDPDELAFSANTSSGMCHAILGIDWKPGDVIVTTNHEHGGGETPMAIAVARHGIEIARLALPVGNDQNAHTLPIADLMNVVRQHELISIVDGAHLPGMMACDYAQLGMDFMAGAGHKWQCGPGSTGILSARPSPPAAACIRRCSIRAWQAARCGTRSAARRSKPTTWPCRPT